MLPHLMCPNLLQRFRIEKASKSDLPNKKNFKFFKLFVNLFLFKFPIEDSGEYLLNIQAKLRGSLEKGSFAAN